MQGLTGDGDVFVKAGGTVIRRDLRDGEQLRISSGCLVAFSHGVDYGTYYHTCNEVVSLSSQFSIASNNSKYLTPTLFLFRSAIKM